MWIHDSDMDAVLVHVLEFRTLASRRVQATVLANIHDT